VIPTILSIYLVKKNGLWGAGLVATGVVSAICYNMATPVPGVGIAIPIFIPPIAAAIAALITSPRKASPLAYVSGGQGTLIGADLLNLPKGACRFDRRRWDLRRNIYSWRYCRAYRKPRPKRKPIATATFRRISDRRLQLRSGEDAEPSYRDSGDGRSEPACRGPDQHWRSSCARQTFAPDAGDEIGGLESPALNSLSQPHAATDRDRPRPP
jgi:hypothetical protein